jgi:hypothetical protein
MSEPTRGGATPDRIFEVATGFMAAKHLFVANELAIFPLLAEGPMRLEALAGRAGVPARTLRIIADAMVVLGFLEREGDAYRNAEVAERFLSGQGEPDMRPFLRFWNRISYPTWLGLEGSIRSGVAATREPATAEEDRVFSEGVEALNAGGARALPDAYDFAKHQSLLNLGGWYVSFLEPVLHRNPGLSATLLMLPQWVERARVRVGADADLKSRVTIVEGDYLFGELPKGHDVVLIANIAHHLSSEQNRAFLKHVRAALAPGARLLEVDFFTDAARTEPKFAALMAAEFQTISGDGDVYSVDDARGWLESSRYRFLEHRPLHGPSSIVIAEAI